MLKRTVAVITRKGEVITRKEAVPELKENEVLIKVMVSLISPGTEMNKPRDRRVKPDGEDEVFGYANAGEVMKVNGDSRGLKAGMRVVAMGTGYAIHGNYAVVPINLVMPIPEDVSYEEAVFAHLGITAMQGVRRAEPALGSYGIVLGQGIVGNLAAQLFQLAGARVITWEGVAARLRIAKKCGVKNQVNFKTTDAVAATQAFCAPYGADFAMLAFGGNATKALDQAKLCMKVSQDGHAMGNIVLIGGCKVEVGGGAWSGNLDFRASSRTGAGYHDAAWEHGRDYPAVFCEYNTRRNMHEFLTLLSEKRVKVAPMITHRMPLAEVGTAADLLLEHPDQALGMILEMKH
ncbi:MAG: zinc-binding alcohol dehydrogenase [Victivallales bacterium]|nr:zinc-binding alcohol dehydrogenase [Victivallales bacterium]